MTPSAGEAAAPTTTVLFNQGGLNLRLGNTLMWAPRAYRWCRFHGFDFYFPAAAAILGQLLSPDSALFEVPEARA